MVAQGVGETLDDAVISEEAEGPGCDAGELFAGFPDVARVAGKEAANVPVSEAADGESWIGDGREEREVLACGLERPDAATTFSFALSDFGENRLKGLRGCYRLPKYSDSWPWS